MDSTELTKIAAAVLLALLLIFGFRTIVDSRMASVSDKPGFTLPAATPAAEAKAEPAKAVSTVARVLSREEPAFPREAIQQGVKEGRVTARMYVDAKGGVTRVDILSAEPRRVFDRSVQRALSQWRFDTGAEGRTVDTEVVFKD